jgi:hypothetical protein
MEKTYCPSCKRKLKNANAWHYCKEVAIDDIFAKTSDELILTFDTILEKVADWEDVEVSATKNCIVFVRNKTFLVIKPMTKFLEVKFYDKEMIEDEELHKCHLWGSKYEGIVRLQNEHQVSSKLLKYFKNSYLIS